MDSIDLWDFGFGVVTTLALGLLAFVQFFADRRRRRFGDTQIALDIQASVTTWEIIELLAKPDLSAAERDFLADVHGVALDRQNAMTAFDKLKPSIREAVEDSLTRIYDAVKEDPRAKERQKAADAAFHTNVVDRSKFTWGESAEKLGKWDALALAGARWLREHPDITTREQFEEQFGRIVRPVVEPYAGKATFDRSLLLEPVTYEGQRDTDKSRGQRWLTAHGHDGVITFDGHPYRIHWDLGLKGKGGGATHLALIEHFRTALGYDIRAVTR